MPNLRITQGSTIVDGDGITSTTRLGIVVGVPWALSLQGASVGSYAWVLGVALGSNDQLSSTTAPSPTGTFTKAGNYFITLNGTYTLPLNVTSTVPNVYEGPVVPSNLSPTQAPVPAQGSSIISDSTKPASLLVTDVNGLQAPISLVRSGATGSRPNGSTIGLFVGFQYYDTTLGSPIWWNGSSWVVGSITNTTTAFSNVTAARGMAAQPFSQLSNGSSILWIDSFKDYFRWNATSTSTDDGIQVINPTLNGVNPGRLIRMLVPATEWMQQLLWTVDSVAGNDENIGSAGAPIKTDAERQRRMGPAPLWNGGAYHVRWVNDVPATDPVRVVGTRARNSNIFLHGSATDGQGQSILFNGSITALTALDNSTAGATHAWHLTAGALSVSWTASSLMNHRIRMTSGVSLGAKSFAIKDLGSKQARCDEFLIKNTYTFPFNFQLNTKAPPSNGDTFVVERLTSIASFFWHIEDVDDGGLNTTFVQGCVESLALGVDSAGNVLGDFNVIVGGDDILCFDGCMCVWFGAGYGGTLFFGSTGIYGQMQPGAWQNVALSGGHYLGSVPPNLGLNAANLFLELQNNFIFQLSGGTFRVQCFCQFFDVGIFDSTASMRLQGTRVEFLGKVWGTGNAGRIAEFDPAARALFSSNAAFPISVGTTPEFGFIFAGTTRTSIPAFDVATNTYTADRTATVTHLTATIAAGGFNNSMADPVSGGALVKQ